MSPPPEPSQEPPPSATPGAEPAETPPAERHADWTPSHNPWLIAVSVMIGTFMEVLDTSIANVSLPHIAGNLSATTDEATWVLTSYLVSNAIILPATAWLGSVFGRKRFLLGCIAIFTLTSALSGAATSLGMLVFARILQGVGGGALQPIAQSILLESFPPHKRGQAMAMYGMGVVVAPVVGPWLGGWITDNYSWRWIFYINIPFGVLATFMVSSFVEDPPYLKRGVGRIDFFGFSFMALWLGTLQIVLDKGQQEDWFAAPWIVWLSVISGVSMVAFILWELRVEHPIVDLRVLRDRNFSVATTLMTVLGVVLYGSTALLPMFLQNLMGYSALQSGETISPRGMGSFASMLIVARLIGRVDSRALIAFGFMMLTATFVMLGSLSMDITPWNVAFPNIVNGLAMGFIFVPLTTASTATLPREEIGNASGIYNLMRNLGGSFGISIVTTMLARSAQMHQTVLAGHMSVYDPTFNQTVTAAQAGLTAASAPELAKQQAVGLMYGLLVQQATLEAFMDTFHAMAMLCALFTPLILIMRKVKPREGPVAAH